MDPNAALQNLREMAQSAIDADDDATQLECDPPNADLLEMAEQFQALDQWIQNGNFLPNTWAEADTTVGWMVAMPYVVDGSFRVGSRTGVENFDADDDAGARLNASQNGLILCRVVKA